MWKECSKCGRIKPLWMFSRNKTGMFGLRPDCKVCDCRTRKQYYQNNRDAKLEYYRQYRQDNRDAELERMKQHYQNNKELYFANAAKRRAMKADKTPELTPHEQKKIVLLYKIRDYLNKDGIYWHVDHIVPLAKGGLHHPDNLQIIPVSDNLSKGADESYELSHNLYFRLDNLREECGLNR